MKTLMTVTVALVALAAFGGLGAAQQKIDEKSQPSGVERRQPPSGERRMDKASPQLMKVKVLEVNEAARTFTIMVKGTPKTLNAPDLKSLPKAGDMVDIAVSDAGGGCTDWYDQHAQLHHCSK